MDSFFISPHEFFLGWFFLLGAAVGSFLNVLIYRLPRGYVLTLPKRSFCTQCRHQISWYENIPILSYLVLRGKCHGCKKKISARYPLVEFLSAILFLAVFRVFGFQPATIYYSFFCAALLAITFIDIDFRIIPDEISISGIVIGFVCSSFITELGWQSSALGILLGGGFFWLISWAYEKITTREGLGFGDVKLIAMIGAVLGIKGVVFTILVSSILGSVIGILLMLIERKNLKMSIPFGPFLSIAAIIYIFYGDYLTVPLFLS